MHQRCALVAGIKFGELLAFEGNSFFGRQRTGRLDTVNDDQRGNLAARLLANALAGFGEHVRVDPAYPFFPGNHRDETSAFGDGSAGKGDGAGPKVRDDGIDDAQFQSP